MNAKKSQRLQPVRQLKHQAERTEARKLAEAQQQLSQAKKQYQELNNYLDEYCNAISNQQSSIRQADLLGRYQAFVTRLNQAIKNQAEQVSQRELVVQSQSQKWATAHANLKAMEELINQAKYQEELEETKKEQKLMDDRVPRNGNGFF